MIFSFSVDHPLLFKKKSSKKLHYCIFNRRLKFKKLLTWPKVDDLPYLGPEYAPFNNSVAESDDFNKKKITCDIWKMIESETPTMNVSVSKLMYILNNLLGNANNKEYLIESCQSFAPGVDNLFRVTGHINN